MILKIERHPDPTRANHQQQWWMFDSIRKISISLPYRKLKGDEDKNVYDAVIFDINSGCTCSDPGDQCNLCINYLVAICRLDNGSEYSIAFDTIAYLLNDNGKTIEKIVANYKL